MIPFDLLAQQCAPMVAPRTMAAIVRVESGGDPLALYDNNTRRRYLPADLPQAQFILSTLMREGHRVDVGIGQVDTENFAAVGLNIDNVFNACTNLHAAGQILQAAYRQSESAYGPGQVALFHAFEAYNSGSLRGDGAYANKILWAAGLPVQVTGGGLRYVERKQPVNPFPMLGWAGVKVASWGLADGNGE